MKTQAEDFHTVYAFMRDSKRGAERAAIGDALDKAESVVSRLHDELRELDAPKPVAPYRKPLVKPARVIVISDEVKARNVRLDFQRAVIAELGGSLTVASAVSTETAAPRVIKHDGLRPKAERDAVHAAQFDKAAAVAANRAKALARERAKALATDEPDMFAVIDAFGNFPNFSKGFLA